MKGDRKMKYIVKKKTKYPAHKSVDGKPHIKTAYFLDEGILEGIHYENWCGTKKTAKRLTKRAAEKVAKNNPPSEYKGTVCYGAEIVEVER